LSNLNFKEKAKFFIKKYSIRAAGRTENAVEREVSGLRSKTTNSMVNI